MAKKLLETVPNYNGGRDMEKVARVATCFKNGKNVRLLDYQTDVSHNCCMITIVGEPEAPRDAAIDSFEIVMQLVDMTKHEGRHPRMGAVDVVPFIPCHNITAAKADTTAKEIEKAVGKKFGIPVFLCEDSVTVPHRADLAKIHKGRFEGMTEKLQDKELWTPDSGPDHIHPAAGVVATGTRIPFIAYNVDLSTDNMEIANHIADAVKNIRGGYHLIRAIGVELRDYYSGKDTVAQASMNLVNYEKTAIYRALKAVEMEARRYSVSALGSEIVGIVPIQSLVDYAGRYLQAYMFGPMEFNAKRQIMKNWFLEDKEEET